jgi:outer membrane immunogenic protein
MIAAVSVIAFTQIASAADLPRKAPAYMPPPLPVLGWTGWYVGLNAGAGWGNNDGIDNTVNSSFCTFGFGGCLPGTPNIFSSAASAAVPLNFNTGNKAGFIGGGRLELLS